MKKLMPVIALLFLILPAMPQTIKENSAFRLGPEWQLANRANDDSSKITEFIRKGDDIHHWQELVTVQEFHRPLKASPREELDRLKALREKECPSATEWNVIEENETSILYEWHVKPCLGWPEQREVARILFGDNSLYFLRYTAKVHELSPETRALWIRNFSSADIESIAESGASPPTPRPDSEEVNGVLPMPIDMVTAALKAAMESQNCRITDSTADRIECKRPRRMNPGRGEDVGGESVTAVLAARGEQTRIHMSTGKGFYGRLGKQNWTAPIYEAMMKRLLAHEPRPTDTSTQAVASSQPPLKTAQDMARELSTTWGQNVTENVRLQLKEMKRGMVHGHTEVVYHLENSGFPPGKTYMLWGRQSGDQMVTPLMGGFSADASGELICPATPMPNNFNPAGRSCISAKTFEESVSLSISNYHKGEPVDYAVISTDGEVRAFAHAYPFPIEAQDGRCRLNAEFEDSRITSFLIRGSGFEPGESVTTSYSFGKDATTGAQTASTGGEFTAAIHADLSGKQSGSATFTAGGKSCHPTITYEWGKAALKAQ